MLNGFAMFGEEFNNTYVGRCSNIDDYNYLREPILVVGID